MPIYKFLTAADDFHSHSWTTPATWIYAGAGNDTVHAISGNADTVDGGSGNDRLRGDKRDVLIGGAGDDTFDLFYEPGSPGIGHRVVEAAGGGWDTLNLNVQGSGTFHMPVNVEALTIVWHDLGQYYLPNFKLFGNDSANIIWGYTQSDTIQGGAGNDSLYGGGQADLLTGDAGDDYLAGEFGADTMWGGYGNDTHDGLAGDVYDSADRMAGSYGDDLYIISENDVVAEYALQGWDTVQTRMSAYTLPTHVEELVFTGTGSATYVGSVFANVIRALQSWTGPLNFGGDDGNDTISGANAADIIAGDDGNDHLSGGGGNDMLRGGNDADSLEGGTGHDGLLGDAGNDTMRGGDGNDVLSGLDHDDQMFGDAGRDTVEGGNGNDWAQGGGDNDSVRGGNGNDTAYGEAGNDTVLGDGGNDLLSGGDGNDLIMGGAGRDTMDGGAGFDTFTFAHMVHTPAYAFDQIMGFNLLHDVINLAAIDADGVYGSYDKFFWVGNAPVAGIKGQLWAVESGGNTDLYGDVSGDGLAEMRISLLGVTGLTDANILL